MKRTIGFALVLFALGFSAFAGNDPYDDYMHRVVDDIHASRMNMDPFAENPFQTGTSLSGYFLSEKTLLLERDAFFQMKSNALKTTDDVADYQHRIQVLRAHANNLLIQLVEAIDQRNQEGFVKIEEPKEKKTLDQIVEDCKKDAGCVADELNRPETSTQNVLLDNFALATQVFKQIPFMHALEVNSVYQLIQLIYLEVLYSENVLSSAEFGIFFEKQRGLFEQAKGNHALSSAEKQFQMALIKNTIDNWKKRILERRFDHRKEFLDQATALARENQRMLTAFDSKRLESMLQREKGMACFPLASRQKRRECQVEKNLMRAFQLVRGGQPFFMNRKEQKLPDEFWRNL